MPLELLNIILTMRPKHPVAIIITEYFKILETKRINHEMIENEYLETEFDDGNNNWWKINENSDSDINTDSDNNSEFEYEDI